MEPGERPDGEEAKEEETEAGGKKLSDPGTDQAACSIIRAGAAAGLSAIMNFAKKRELAGLEFCAGIPGKLGGALAGNAGAGGGDICSLVDCVEVVDGEGRLRTRRRGGFAYGYRSSDLRGDVIVAASLRLRHDSRAKIDERIGRHLAKRLDQPLGDRSSGCMFKNPPGEFAGRLIDRAGLKGLRVGGVSVALEHANFMINDGHGTAADVQRLMDQVRERVLTGTGIELEGEVRWPRAQKSGDA